MLTTTRPDDIIRRHIRSFSHPKRRSQLLATHPSASPPRSDFKSSSCIAIQGCSPDADRIGGSARFHLYRDNITLLDARHSYILNSIAFDSRCTFFFSSKILPVPSPRSLPFASPSPLAPSACSPALLFTVSRLGDDPSLH